MHGNFQSSPRELHSWDESTRISHDSFGNGSRTVKFAYQIIELWKRKLTNNRAMMMAMAMATGLPVAAEATEDGWSRRHRRNCCLGSRSSYPFPRPRLQPPSPQGSDPISVDKLLHVEWQDRGTRRILSSDRLENGITKPISKVDFVRRGTIRMACSGSVKSFRAPPEYVQHIRSESGSVSRTSFCTLMEH
ncbi:transcriptional regulator GntR family [Anopheles sinensis]|uniref:Transcriptional regulator GntR family n=1 Tax=Anopheles sinensis TaxID=74873 RepID=A0A084WS83_ANOSI|nr:transcriptional regulator GntR family [Anopheles sinensis]